MPISNGTTPTLTARDEDVELHIMLTLRRNGRLGFAVLAEVLPQYRWCDLLSALNRLKDQGYMEVASVRGRVCEHAASISGG
jgi:hypothetical protein